jgi:formylglycine-generating enzyme required for sulfatase activity
MLRGGSWFGNPDGCRSAFRNNVFLDYGIGHFGFRVVCGGAART